MSASTHQIKVRAVDQTAGAFGSIANRAAAAGAQIRSLLGGALAAAGAYLGFRAFKGGIEELGKLSDIAMKTSTSVDELTKTATALGVLGIQNMSIENLARSFDYMAKTTGRAGMEGLFETIEEIGAIPDAATRAQTAMKVFGSSGMEFMPLINAAKTGTAALKEVVAAMPAIPQAAADAGDAAADAMSMAGSGIKSLWLQLLGGISSWLNNTFDLGLRGAAVAGVAHIEFFVKSAWRHVTGFFTSWADSSGGLLAGFAQVMKNMLLIVKEWAVAAAKIMAAPTQGFFNELFADAAFLYDWAATDLDTALRVRKGTLEAGSKDSIADRVFRAWETAAQNTQDLTWLPEGVQIDTADLQKKLDEKLAAAKVLDVNISEAAIGLKDRQLADAKQQLEMTIKAPTIKNDLMLGGSAAANRAALLGPQLQSESKKQTALLGKIADNTAATADNTEDKTEIELTEF